jgi:hypothetical protein
MKMPGTEVAMHGANTCIGERGNVAEYLNPCAYVRCVHIYSDLDEYARYGGGDGADTCIGKCSNVAEYLVSSSEPLDAGLENK